MQKIVSVIVTVLVCCFALLQTQTIFSAGYVAQDCTIALPTRLVVGKEGQVTPGTGNDIRDKARRKGKSIGKIPSDGIFSVIEGPVCGDNLAWWRVEYEGITGWTPEGENHVYWLTPYDSKQPKPNRLVYSLYGVYGAVERSLKMHDFTNGTSVEYPIIDEENRFTVSPDGSRILYTGTTVTGGKALRIYNTVDRTTKDLYEKGNHTAWSPDGKNIAIHLYENYVTRTLSLMDATTYEMSSLYSWTDGIKTEQSRVLAWSPDSQYIATIGAKKGEKYFQFEILLTSLKTRQTVSLGSGGFGSYNVHADISWSPDSALVVFDTLEGDLVLYDVAKKTREVLTKGTGPAWSPDGNRIAFSRINPDFGTGIKQRADLCVINFETRAERCHTQLGKAGVVNSKPRWSPDSRLLAFKKTIMHEQYAENILQVMNLLGKVQTFREESISWYMWLP